MVFSGLDGDGLKQEPEIRLSRLASPFPTLYIYRARPESGTTQTRKLRGWIRLDE
jgi:hypothetical protein